MNTNTQQSGAGQRNRRKSVLINPAFQWKYALALGIGVFLTTSIMSCVLYATLHEEARQRFVNPSAANVDVGFIILLSAFAFSVLTAGTVIALSVITSHRVCGPLYVLEGYFKQLAAGRVPKPRKLRKKDEFKEVFEAFVKATQSMRFNQQERFRVYEGVIDAINQVDRSNEQACSQALSSVLDEVTALRNELAEALDIERKPLPSDDQPDPARNVSPEHQQVSA